LHGESVRSYLIGEAIDLLAKLSIVFLRDRSPSAAMVS
jgi:hypothetical protein